MATADIITRVAAFYPTYDSDKLDVLIEQAQGDVVGFCGLAAYPDDYAPLDVIVARLVRLAIADEERGFATSRSIEGFSESFSANSINGLTDHEKSVLRNIYFGGIPA